MQFLIFHLGKDRYGLHTRDVVRVLPLMELKQMPQTPAYVAGLMNFRGSPVPVIDLCMLASGSACPPLFDTRIILVDYVAAEERHLLGLIAERVSGVEHIDPATFVEPGVSSPDAPFLGNVAARGQAMLQLINIEYLLPDEVRALLFRSRAETMP